MIRTTSIELDGRQRPGLRALHTVLRAPWVVQRAAALPTSGRPRVASPALPGPRTACLVPEGRPRDLAARAAGLQRLACALCDHHRLLVDLRGPRPLGPAVLVANHLSYLDALVILSGAAALPIAKAEVARWPVIGRRVAGSLFVDRGCMKSRVRVLRRALRVLGAGVSLLNFPEGTTSDGREVLPFFRGIFGVARLAGVPVVPIRIDYDSPTLAWVGDDRFLGHYLRFAGRPMSAATVQFMPALDPRAGSAEALAARAREALRR